MKSPILHASKRYAMSESTPEDHPLETSAATDLVLPNTLDELLARSGRNDEARQAFQQALERDPTYARAWVNLGVLHARTGEMEEARRCYGQALEADPSCHSAHLKLANLLARESRWEEALRSEE